MNRPVDNTAGYTPPSYTPPPPPPPTVDNLVNADAATAGRAIDAMTPQQQATLTAQLAQLPAADRANLLNGLATKLDAGQLGRLEPVFGAPAVLEAVQTRSPATVRETYEAQAGAAPAAATAPASGRSDAAQVAQAQADYADQVQGTGIMGQHALGTLMTANAGDPAYLAELVRLGKDEGVLDMVVSPMYGGLYQKENGQYTVTTANGAAFDADARRAAFATAIGAAVDRGVLTEADVRQLGVGNSGWADVAQRAGIGQVGATDATRATSARLDGLVGDYGDARDKVQALDQELGTLLAQSGPMTPQQQAAFVRAFRDDPGNAATYAALTGATTALTDYVTANRDAVLDAAVRDPAVAAQVRDAMVGMARDGRGLEVMALLTEINAGGPDSALAQAFAGFDELSGPVLEDAASSAMTQLLERNNGDATAAAAAFKTTYLSLLQGWPVKAGIDDFKIGSKLLDAAAAGDTNALRGYLADYDAKSPVFRALAGAGIVLGAVGAINAGTQDDYVNMVAGFAQSGENAARLVAGAMGSMSAVGQALEGGARFGGFAARIAPGLGLIANSASLVNSINQASDGNVGYAIAIAGDVLGILGSALEFTPVAPAGFILSGIGAVINGVGSFIGEVINGNERRDTLERYMKAAGVDASIVDEMANSGKQLFEMADRLDMTPEQVQALVKAYPDIGGAPGLAGTFTDVAAAAGISGGDVQGFAARLSGENADFAWDLMGIAGMAPANPGQAAAFYRDYLEGRYPDAAGFAQAASPELFGAAAQDRESAQAAYSRDGFSSTWEMSLGNDLKNNDSPAYRAEMMRLLAADGGQRLEMFAQMLGGYGDNWEGAVRASVADALAAGTLTQAQADTVLSYF